MSRASVYLWGREVGAVTWDAAQGIGIFQYHDEFVDIAQSQQLELNPKMPIVKGLLYQFTHLSRETFWGLPGMLADCLPDKFGNNIINAYLSSQNLTSNNFNPVDRLLYIGDRAMGALEFKPSKARQANQVIDIKEVIHFSQAVLAGDKDTLTKYFNAECSSSFKDLIQVTTSAGGAKAKALLSFNSETEHFIAFSNEKDYSDWMIKFDQANQQHEFLPTTRVEYAYYLQALKSGIDMAESRLFLKDGYYHFMTRRFDRDKNHKKIFTQTLCGLFHMDFAQPHAYETAMKNCLDFGLGYDELEKLFHICVFNMIYRNEDDHTKNISLSLNKAGEWSLAPAYDLTYTHTASDGFFLPTHQMSINGKNTNVTLEDLEQCGIHGGLKRSTAKKIIDKILAGREYWENHAQQAYLSDADIQFIASEINRF